VDWSFLSYFAVGSSERGQGLGRRLWRATTAYLVDHGAPSRIVLEVEVPEQVAHGSPEWTVRQRRIHFYTRCGASVLSVHGYVMPSFDGKAEQPMVLMASV